MAMFVQFTIAGGSKRVSLNIDHIKEVHEVVTKHAGGVDDGKETHKTCIYTHDAESGVTVVETYSQVMSAIEKTISFGARR